MNDPHRGPTGTLTAPFLGDVSLPVSPLVCLHVPHNEATFTLVPDNQFDILVHSLRSARVATPRHATEPTSVGSFAC